MGFVYSTDGYRLTLLVVSGALALLTALLLTVAAHPEEAVAQISPLSPLTVATPLPQSQPLVIPTEAVSPFASPQPGGEQFAQNPTANRAPELAQPIDLAQAPPSLLLVAFLLGGLLLFVVVLLVARRRE